MQPVNPLSGPAWNPDGLNKLLYPGAASLNDCAQMV